MSSWWNSLRPRRGLLGGEAVTGLIMAIITIPGDLANGVLAGVNPVYALYTLMVAPLVAGLFTSSVLMNVDSTSAAALSTYQIVSDSASTNPLEILVVLAMLVGVFQLAFGLLKLGFLVRFISNAVMTGFLTGIAILTILGQAGDLTGYYSDASNKVTQAIDTLLHVGEWQPQVAIVGFTTVATILILDRTRLTRFAFLIGLVFTTLLANSFFAGDVPLVGETTSVPRSLPSLQLPDLSLVPSLLLPALSLSIILLVQAAGVSQGYPNPDGSYPDPSGDFRGQGAANFAVGLVGGVAAGGSLSNTALIVNCGAKGRWANIFTSVFAAGSVLLLAPLIDKLPMASLAGVLVATGITMINRQRITVTWRTGTIPAMTMLAVFVVTLFVPLQYAVLFGILVTFALQVYRSGSRVRVEALAVDAAGGFIEIDTPQQVADREVVILQPVGSLFFAGAAGFESNLPDVDSSSRSAVVLRLREYDEIGSTLVRALTRYATRLQARQGRLYLAGVEPHVIEQLRKTELIQALGEDAVFPATPRRGESVKMAAAAAQEWVGRQAPATGADGGSFDPEI